MSDTAETNETARPEPVASSEIDIDPKEWVHDHPLTATLIAGVAGFAAGSGLGTKAVGLLKAASTSEPGKRIAATVYPMARKAVLGYLRQEVSRLVPGMNGAEKHTS